MAKIKINVEKTSAGFSAYAEKHAAFTTGKTVAELAANMVESLNLLFERERKITRSDLTFCYLTN